jgi:hypothetical protein
MFRSARWKVLYQQIIFKSFLSMIWWVPN